MLVLHFGLIHLIYESSRLRNILSDNWSLLKVNNRLKHVLKEQPIVAYRRNKSLRDVIRDTTIKNNKVVRKQKAKLKGGYYKPCFSRTSSLCCKQVVPGTAFKSNVTLKTYQIFHQLNFKNSYIICLLECFKCQVQYVRKSETKLKKRTKTSIQLLRH